MADPGPAVTRFAFERGEFRGTNLTLFATCLVHRGDNHLETLPFAGMSAVRVTFERDPRKIGWGIALVMVALLLLAIAGPLERFAAWMQRTAGETTAWIIGILGFLIARAAATELGLFDLLSRFGDG